MVALFLIQTSNSSSNYTKLLNLLWPLNSFHTQVIFLCIFLCPSASFAASFHHPSSYFLCTTVGHNALTSAVGDKGQGRLMGSSRDWSLHANPAAFTLARGKISVNWPKFPQAWTVETYLKTIKNFPMENTTLQLDLVSSCYYYYYYFSDGGYFRRQYCEFWSGWWLYLCVSALMHMWGFVSWCGEVMVWQHEANWY